VTFEQYARHIDCSLTVGRRRGYFHDLLL